MLNYGEELAYWYLRLNGFFLIDNFVLHRDSEERTSDADMLAVRFPHVYESIGGQSNDWDTNFLENFKSDSVIGLICEVKTGTFNRNNLFRLYNIRKSLGRFGFVSDFERYIKNVEENSIYNIKDNIQVGKVLFSNTPANRSDIISIELSQAVKFIKSRMIINRERKYADRMFFPSSLLQYIIWQEEGNINDNI